MGRTLIAPISYGLGDLVVSLPVIQALIDSDPEVWLVARAASQRRLAERISGLAGVVDEAELTRHPGDRFIDLRDHPLQRDCWWGSATFEERFGQLTINDILERISGDFGIKADFSNPVPLRAKPRPGLSNSVLLVHETDGSDKIWPIGHWRVVAGTLRAEGHDTAVVLKEEGPSPVDVPRLVAATPGMAVDVLSGCRAVIGIDTGLTHIAVQQGIPTVTICRRNSVYPRPWSHSAVLRGAACTDLCLEAETRYAYNQTVSLRHFRPRPRVCPSGSPCLAAARPEDAIVLLRGLL